MAIIFCCFLGNAQELQRYNSFNYNVNEGLLQSNIMDIAFDKNNFCWLGFANGIQKFDGKNFINIPVQSGLPDDKLVKFFQCHDGVLLISHSRGISKYDINSNRFNQVYNNSSLVKSPVIFIGEDENIIYIYTETGNIVGIDCQTFKVISDVKSGLPGYFLNNENRPKLSDNIINHKVALLINYRLHLWDLKHKKLLYQSASIAGISYFFMALKTEDEVLYYNNTAKINLEAYNFKTKTNKIISVTPKDAVNAFRSNVYLWQNKQLLSLNNKLYETGMDLQKIKYELVNHQNLPIAGNVPINQIKEDYFGNLYLVTISDGFKKISRNSYPIKYYGTEKKENNYVVSILTDKKNNRVLAGTFGNGLLVFDTMQHLLKHIKTLPGRNYNFSPSSIIKNGDGDYLLFLQNENYVWKLSNDLTQLSSIKIISSLPDNKRGIGYFGNILYQDKQVAVIQTGGRLYRTRFTDNTVTENLISSNYTMSGFLYNNSIITHSNDELIFLDTSTFKEQKKIPFNNTGGVRCFAKNRNNEIFIGSNKGIFKIDVNGKIIFNLNKQHGLPDECIYSMTFDNGDFLWCSTNKGIYKINKDNSILQLKKEDGLQENEFNTNVVAKSEDGELFFGGVNGISSFFPSSISNLKETINLLVTNIKVNNDEEFKDTAVWNIEKIELPYNKNLLSFDFIAMAGNNPGQYIYQYKMDGVDEKWIQNNELQTVRYFLPPGKYVFKVTASRFFNKDAKSMKEIRISIRPPFWKTWWFFTGMVILLISALMFGINRINKKKFDKKLKELDDGQILKLERERISMDLHDSIGAYANAVLYNTELLQKVEENAERQELIKDLHFASKDIITSLRETIWALKKDNYTAEDCLLRIRNFIQPFNRYYPLIQFKIEGEAPKTKNFHYSKALQLVRIVQEAVTNSIKHAEAKNITIQSRNENQQWEIVVSDDGKGFDNEDIKQLEYGNGLKNMQQRANDAGLIFSIISLKDKGTTVSIAG